jgi:methionyl aminopeptidase
MIWFILNRTFRKMSHVRRFLSTAPTPAASSSLSFRLVPAHIPRPDYTQVYSCAVPSVRKGTWPSRLYDEEDIKAMRIACRTAATVREYTKTVVSPGISTDEIDRALHDKIISLNAYPSALGYAGTFPKSIVTSVNDVLVHGIPNKDVILKDGDIISVDVVTFKGGFHGDCCGNFLVGDVDELGRKLVETSDKATRAAVSICAPGVDYAAIGDVVW